mgnify:CR=1 FL=1
MLEIEPFKNDITYLKERENSMTHELGLMMGGSITAGQHSSMSHKGLLNDTEGILSKLSVLE